MSTTRKEKSILKRAWPTVSNKTTGEKYLLGLAVPDFVVCLAVVSLMR